MKAESKTTIGIAWYNRRDYSEVRGVMEDSDVLPNDYDTWLGRAEAVLELEQAKGSVILKALIVPDAFAAWCRATDQRPNAGARTCHVNLAIEDYCGASHAIDSIRRESLPERIRHDS